MQPIPLEPGMRVRCVQPDELIGLHYGDEHVVYRTDFHPRTGKYRIWVDNGNRWFRANRFKPIVRVKAPSVRTVNITINTCGCADGVAKLSAMFRQHVARTVHDMQRLTPGSFR
jgi:hypothetical protein